MLDISLQNFETDLIAASKQQPILLDIWAPWCGPCKALGPVLEKLEAAYAGRFVLAKLNSDEQPEIAAQLSQMFGVRSIPFCVLFKDGQPADGFVGALPEAQVRAFLDKHVPSAAEVAAEEDISEAEQLLEAGDVDSALLKLRDAVAGSPGNDAALYDYLHALLSAGRVDDARRALQPPAKNLVQDPRIRACALWLQAIDRSRERPVEPIEAALAVDKRDFDARYELAQHHFAAQRFTQSLDELLEILMRDKAWRDGLARTTYVAILELMGRTKPAALAAAPKGTIELAGAPAALATNPLVDSYRRRLSMVVF